MTPQEVVASLRELADNIEQGKVVLPSDGYAETCGMVRLPPVGGYEAWGATNERHMSLVYYTADEPVRA